MGNQHCLMLEQNEQLELEIFFFFFHFVEQAEISKRHLNS